MKQELEEALIRDFPNLYRKGSLWIDHGFRCNDGWEPLIRELSGILENYIIYQQEEDRTYMADQVKEKFGALRFYVSWYDPDVQKIIDEFEQKSRTICEYCGEPGKIERLRGYYYQAICYDCYLGPAGDG